MTGPHERRDEWPGEEALARGLDRRAAQVFGAPVSLADVRRRARSIRRRRVAAATTAAAAAVAVVAVVPAALGSIGSHRGDRPQPAPSVPTSTATPDHDASTGAGAAVLHGGRLTLPDGRVVPLPVDVADVSGFGVLDDGRVVVADQRTSAIEVYAADGSLAQRHPAGMLDVTMSAAGNLAAWVDRDGRVEVLESGGAEPVRLAPVPVPGGMPVVDAALGSRCAAGGCSVLVGDGSTTVGEVTVDATRDVETPEPLRVDDVSADGRSWAVTFPPSGGDQQHGCVGLYDPATRRVTARTCGSANLRFAPDGRTLVGGFFENGAAAEVQLLDRRLRVVRTYRPADAVVSRVGWSAAGHVLAATATQAAAAGPAAPYAWSLVSVPVDAGDPVVVEGPVDGGDPEQLSEYLFSD